MSSLYNFQALNHSELTQLTQRFGTQLRSIRAFLTDVDGVLTTGHLYYSGQEVGFNRFFHASDGHGLKMLMRAGLEVGVISGGDSLGLRERLNGLGITHQYLGNEDKRQAYLKISSLLNCQDHEILYIGDDVFDIPLLKRVGLGITVPHASWDVKQAADHVTRTPGGMGAVREIVDLLRFSKNLSNHVQDF